MAQPPARTNSRHIPSNGTMTSDALPKRINNGTTKDHYNVRTPEEPPDAPIPPKPPYSAHPEKATRWQQHKTQHNWLGHKVTPICNPYAHRTQSTTDSQSVTCHSSTNSIQNTTTTSDSQWSWVTSDVSQVNSEQWMQWENMQTFYSSTKQWPTGIRVSWKEGASPLVQTMLHWLPTTRLQMYAWNDVVSKSTDNPKDHEIERKTSFSQAKWNNRRESNKSMPPVQADNFPSRIHRLQTLSKKVTQPPPDPPRDSQEPSTPKRQWANM